MKKLFLFVGLFLTASFALAQNELKITINKSGTNITATVDSLSLTDANEYEVDFSNGGTIRIHSNVQTLAVKTKIQNRSLNADTIFTSSSLTFDDNHDFKIVFDKNKQCTTPGTTHKPLTNKFKVVIGVNTFNIALKEKEKQNPTSLAFQPTGIPLWDAFTLNNSYKQSHDNKSTILGILSYYTALGDQKKHLIKWSDALHEPSFQDNRFLMNYIQTAMNNDSLASAEAAGVAPGLINMVSSISNTVGGLDVTNIADGFAKFIVKRTREELSASFFSKFKNEINKYPDLRTVFPQTYTALMAIDSEVYMYQGYIQTLRESFEKDLSTLPSNLPSIISNHQQFFDALPELEAMLNTGFYVSQQIQNHQHPGIIIEQYPLIYLNHVNINVKPAFQTMQLLSMSVRSNSSSDNYWSSYDDIQKLFAIGNDELLKIFLGLLEQQAKLNGITFYESDTTNKHLLSTIIDASYNDFTNYKTYLQNFTQKTKNLEIKISSLKKMSSDSLLFENYYQVVSGTIDLMRYLTTINNLPYFSNTTQFGSITSLITPYFNISQTSCDIAIDVNRRNYASAIVNTVSLYGILTNQEHMQQFVAARNTDKSSSEINDIVKDSIDKFNVIKGSLYKYGTFMATVVQAQSSDDVENAIEAFALPTGSSSVKRATCFNVSLNSYAGLFVGNEIINGVDKNQPFSELNSFGITAPIGLAVSWGHHILFFKSNHVWSTSIFISLVDLGAIASFRFKNDSIAQVPTIQLKDIFSPGAFLSIGFPKTPISFNTGVQIGPNLREVSSNKDEFSNNVYVRYSASICVDIPIFNFYTKSK